MRSSRESDREDAGAAPMSKLYSYTYMSLDGVIESPGKWSSPFFTDEMGRDLRL